MPDFSGAEQLAREHPVFEMTITRNAKQGGDYGAAITTFGAGRIQQRGDVTGTGHGDAPTIDEAVAHAVSDYTSTSGEGEAAA